MRITSLIIALGISSSVSAAAIDEEHTENRLSGASSSPNLAAKDPATARNLVALPPEALAQIPAIEHIARSGARLFEAGTAHGLRTIVARQGGEFMILHVTPDGAAVVAGLQAELSAENLLAIAGQEHVTELGSVHGMRGIFVRNGEQFQVFYASPDGERVIPGVMWDATGKNITREQVAPLPGVTPSVVIGDDKGKSNSGGTSPPAIRLALDAAEQTAFGLIGPNSAPRLYVFVDPLCGYSVKALQQLQTFIARGLVQGAIIPVAVLDYEDQGRSTSSALSLLSKPSDQLAAAWSHGDLSGPTAADAADKLKRNMAVAESIRLRGTPTLIWRKADGSEGRLDGLPEDWSSIIASMQGERDAAR